MSCSILRPGLLTTIQDAGRYGYQQAGVIVSGPMDPWAQRLTNLLVGNPAGTAGLEITLLGPTIRFEADHLICISGADLSATLDDQKLPLNRAMAVRQGSTLAFGAARSGCRAYLALSGGFAVPTVLGSQSTYLRAQLGGLEGRSLQAGDVVPAVGPTPAGQQLHQRLLAHSPDQRWVAAPWYPEVAPAPASGTVTTVRAIRGRSMHCLPTRASRTFGSRISP
ncbi:biotin-dependent carboxyltransferase family protein [Hymenobacter sp. 5414T-23]|nr:biotin-dependent carboxyltransferase family protein [Hymenobacter sp. 5414T-23]UOQ81774.1 biotin-dependent carboxyltransferase family protein [Hymenobacter sp. 5414T-23]